MAEVVRKIYRFDEKKGHFVCVADCTSQCVPSAMRPGDVVSLGRGTGYVDARNLVVRVGGGLPPRFNATVAALRLLGRRVPETIKEEEHLWRWG